MQKIYTLHIKYNERIILILVSKRINVAELSIWHMEARNDISHLYSKENIQGISTMESCSGDSFNYNNKKQTFF